MRSRGADGLDAQRLHRYVRLMRTGVWPYSGAQRLRNEVAEWVEGLPSGYEFTLSEVTRRFAQLQRELSPDIAFPDSQMRRITQMLRDQDRLIEFVDDRGRYQRR